MPTETRKNANASYYEYAVIAGPWKGLEARLLQQPTHFPEYADVELRDGRVVRGPFRLALDALKWKGPRDN